MRREDLLLLLDNRIARLLPFGEAPGKVINFLIAPVHGLRGGKGGKLSGKAGAIEDDRMILLHDLGETSLG